MHPSKTIQLFNDNKLFYKIKLDDVEESLKFLLESNFPEQSIKDNPTVLMSSKTTLDNRLKILEECSFKNIKVLYLAKFLPLINRKVSVLKAYNFLDIDRSVVAQLKERMNVKSKIKENLSEDDRLVEIRMVLMKYFLMEQLNSSSNIMNKLFLTYPRIKHKSYENTLDVINLLQSDLGFTKERILRNGYLMHANAQNIRDILKNIPQIDGKCIKEILLQRPKIIMSNCKNLEKSISHIKSFGIPESSINKCSDVLTLSADTIAERLNGLRKIEEFSVLCNHPRVLRLVHYRNKALSRLNFLQQMKVKCVSLHVLAGSSDSFEK